MLQELQEKTVRRVVGLISGTSVDGIDAALVELTGEGETPSVKLLAFRNHPLPPAVREQIFEIFDPEKATVKKIGYLNFLLGEYFAKAALDLIAEVGLTSADVDLIGSHGQTIWHEPIPCEKDGYPVLYTVQIGEGAVIASRTGIPTVSDFRVGDMAMGGQAAPLVPFSEYLLYRRENETILLQNIGGIGNMTVLPAAAKTGDVYAFDTGPGNMIMDAVVTARTGGVHTYDDGGALGAQGMVCQELLELLKQESYYAQPLPKTTGRELFGTQYAQKLLDYGDEHGLSTEALVATATDLTAWSIVDAYEKFVLPRHRASEFIVGGGGSYNKTLLAFLAARFAPHGVKVLTQEDLGWNSDAKEAVAFAIMADRTVHEQPNTLPSVTGAIRETIIGKISLPLHKA